MQFKLFRTIYGVQKEQGWWYAVQKKYFLGVCYSTKYIEDSGVMLFSTKDTSTCGFYHEIDAEKIISTFKEKVKQRNVGNEGFKEVK